MNNIIYGIPNIGSTCWISSLLQLLLSSSYFQIYLNNTHDGKLTKLLKSLPNSINEISLIINNHNLSITNQQDSQEGFLLLLDILHKEHELVYNTNKQLSDIQKQMLKFSNNKISEIQYMFQGITLRYDSDGKHYYEPFINLFCNYTEESSTINKCSDLIYSAFYSDPNKHIIAFPPIITFCIERTQNINTYILLDKFIVYPYKLDKSDKSDKSDESVTYLLKGVILHSGNQSFGHYTTLRIFNNNWYICDDSNITNIGNLPDKVNQVPRLLIYERL